MQPYKKGDSSHTISFLKFLIKQRPNSKLTIIWDGASYHKSQDIRDYLDLVNKEKSPEEWKINCILFAPNAPEQNPVEDIWLPGKSLMRKFAYRCKSLAIVKRLFMFFLNRQIFGFRKIICMDSVHKSFRIAIFRPIVMSVLLFQRTRKYVKKLDAPEIQLPRVYLDRRAFHF